MKYEYKYSRFYTVKPKPVKANCGSKAKTTTGIRKYTAGELLSQLNKAN